MHLWNSSLYLKPEQTGRGLENKRSLLSQSHFLNFTLTRPLLHTLTRCASHKTTCWLQRALPLWDRWGAGFCRVAWLEIRNALLLPPPHPLPPPPPPPPSFPNGSYQTHQEICDRTILKTMRRLPPTSPEVEDYECKCFASVCSLSVHATVLFLHKLNVMRGSLMSPEFKVSCREHKSFCLGNKKRQDAQRVYSYSILLMKISFINSLQRGTNSV